MFVIFCHFFRHFLSYFVIFGDFCGYFLSYFVIFVIFCFLGHFCHIFFVIICHLVLIFCIFWFRRKLAWILVGLGGLWDDLGKVFEAPGDFGGPSGI